MTIDHRQPPQTSHVERFVERAAVDRCFAEEAETDLIAAAILDREADSRRDRDVGADDAVAAQEVVFPTEEVHRAALAVRAACCLAEQLGHDGTRRDAAGDRLRVVAIGRDHVIIVAQHGDRARAGRFLPDVQVAEAADLAECVRLARLAPRSGAAAASRGAADGGACGRSSPVPDPRRWAPGRPPRRAVRTPEAQSRRDWRPAARAATKRRMRTAACSCSARGRLALVPTRGSSSGPAGRSPRAGIPWTFRSHTAHGILSGV